MVICAKKRLFVLDRTGSVSYVRHVMEGTRVEVLPEQRVTPRLIAEPCFHKYALFYLPRFSALRIRVRLDHQGIERLCRESGGRFRISETTLRKLEKQEPVSLTRACAAFDVINNEYHKRVSQFLREEDEIFAAVCKIVRLKEWRQAVGLSVDELTRASGVPAATVEQVEQGCRVTKPTAERLVEATRTTSDAGAVSPLNGVAISTTLSKGETPRAAFERWP